MAGPFESPGSNPTCFTSYSAENEPDIDRNFVRPSYFPEVVKRGMAHQTLILFGERGAWKYASRIAFFIEAWKTIPK